VNPNPGGINNGRGRAKIGKKSSFLVNLLITLAVAFATLAAYYYIGGTVLGIAAVGISVAGSAALAIQAAYQTVINGIAAAYNWLFVTNPYGWVILAVIAVLCIAGVDIGSELANAEDSIKDGLADVNDWIDSW
jgi:hypothetical protein